MKALATIGAVASTAIIANVAIKATTTTIAKTGGTFSGMLFLAGGAVARIVTPFWVKRS